MQNADICACAEASYNTHLKDKHCDMRHAVEIDPQVETFFRHTHLTYEILYFVRGEAEYNVEGQMFTLHPHDLVFIPPKKFHYLHLKSGATYERYCSNFDARILPPESRERLENLPSVWNIENKPILRACFEKMDEYAARFSEADARLMLRCTLREILLNLLYEAPEIQDEDDVRRNRIIDRIISLIETYPDRDWNAESLSRELFLSKSYIQNVFSQYMDIGLKTYINTKKILYAQSLLLSGDRPADVCEVCGFRDYSTFYRLFRKITGTTPNEIVKGI